MCRKIDVHILKLPVCVVRVHHLQAGNGSWSSKLPYYLQRTQEYPTASNIKIFTQYNKDQVGKNVVCLSFTLPGNLMSKILC